MNHHYGTQLVNEDNFESGTIYSYYSSVAMHPAEKNFRNLAALT